MFYSIATRPSHGVNRNATPASQAAVDRFLNDTFSSLTDTVGARSASVQDLENSYRLQLDLPGLAKDQLDIGIEGDVVRVASKTDAPRSFKAAWRFPLEIDATLSTAKLENGVLTLSLGKKQAVSQVTALTIN